MKRSALIIGALSASCSIGTGDIIADSVDDFGSTQGSNGWFYGYYLVSEGDSPTLPGSFRQLEVFGSEFPNTWNRPGTSDWASITDMSFHPHLPGAGRGDPGEFWTTRRWVSDRADTLRFSGLVDEADLGGDSVNVYIYVDGVEFVEWQLSSVTNSMIEYDFDIEVGVGTTVDFVVTPKLNVFFDGTILTVTIEGDPACVVDFTGDDLVDIFDVFEFIALFNAMDDSADITGDEVFDIFDVFGFVDLYNAGCP